nr:hypothetical protein [Akkermansiaceae bacterium]
RFVIQEIITQDWSGVLFRAMDMESGKFVGLHLFFPFGLTGVEAEGLSGDEREEYRAGVQQIAEFWHPSFRTVLTGGCDPVDGVPFVVTEWIEGKSLAEIVEHGALEPETAFELFNEALQLCEALSAKLGAEALWVSMLPEMIVLDTDKHSRGFTFGLSPNRWLVDSRDRRSLKPMANLLDHVMGWSGRMVGDHMGSGLGSWVKWLRGPGQTASLAEARRMLSRATGREPMVQPDEPSPTVPSSAAVAAPGVAAPAVSPAPATPPSPAPGPPLPTPASRAPLPAGAMPGSSAPGKGMWIAMALLVMAIAGVLVWVSLRPEQPGAAGNAKSGQGHTPPLSAAEQASKRAAELAGQTQYGAFIDVSETDAIRHSGDQDITVVGEVTAVRMSRTGKTLFVEFQNAVARGRVIMEDADASLTEQALARFIGKRVRLTGQVNSLSGKPVIDFTFLAAIQEVP